MMEAATAFQTQMDTMAEKTLEGLHVAAQGIIESTVKLTEMSTNYHNALHFTHLTPRLKAREGIKSWQGLVDFESDQGQVPFTDNPLLCSRAGPIRHCRTTRM